MTTDSPRAKYVYSYDRAAPGGAYTAVAMSKVEEDGTLVVVDQCAKPHMTRLDILEFAVAFIKKQPNPISVAINIGPGEMFISAETVDEIFAGRVTARDLLIGT